MVERMDGSSLSIEQIRQRIADDLPVAIRDDQWRNETIDYAVMVLRTGLAFIGKENLLDQMAYCLRELIDNARKANIKRTYFEEEKLDILSPADYEKGMVGFHDHMRSDLERYLAAQARKNLWVEVSFLVTLSALRISVTNNSAAVDTEHKRILHKKGIASVYNSIVEVMDDIEDATESAGLGLVTVSMILRKLGVPDQNFTFYVEGGKTTFHLDVPLSLVTDEETESIGDELARDIRTIPQFPKSVMSLQKVLRDPKVDLQKVAYIIRRDPSLTMELLRMANSAFYRRLNKITSIEIAVGILGLRGIGAILQSYGAKKALEGKYSGKLLDSLWEHSSAIAGITAALSCKFGLSDEEEEIAYVGGLLHDIGKIVLEGRHPSTYAALKDICAHKRTSAAVVEDLIEGVNHALIGAKMAEQWNIPEPIVDIIRFSRTPFSTPEPSRKAATMIYLAHLIYFKLHGDAPEYEAAAGILDEFGLGGDANLDGITCEMRDVLATL